MAYIRTARHAHRTRQATFVPGGLACAAIRSPSLASSARRIVLSASPLRPSLPARPSLPESRMEEN